MNAPVDIAKINFSTKKRVPMIPQVEFAECGLACLAMVSAYYQYDIDLALLRQRFSNRLRGMDLSNLIDIANAIGLNGRALKCPLERLDELKLPAILHWDMNHFVVVTKVKKGKIYINDPADGKKVLLLRVRLR